MKPRTKIEKQLCEMAAKLPPLTEAQRRYGVKQFPSSELGLYRKGEIWCTNCGKVHQKQKKGIKLSDAVNGYVCPHCGKTIELKNSRLLKNFYCDELQYAIVQTVKEWTVVRCFDGERTIYRGGDVEVYFHERFTCWISASGKEYITGKQYTRSIYGTRWLQDTDGSYDIKKHNASANGYYSFDDMFDLTYYTIYPRASVNPIYKRNGWSKELLKLRCSVVDLLKALHNPQFEYLVKTKQYDVLSYLLRKGEKKVPYLHAVKICNRNGYAIKDVSLWYDYVDCLDNLGKDTHNAYYVCPDDLRSAHDRVFIKWRAKIERENKDREAKRIAELESSYASKKGKYFGICFGNEDIVITVIKSVAEMAEEGNAMHHCVFACGYYDKDSSLILSAKDRAGNRVETIEVSLKTYQVLQSRGVCNRNTQYHDKIIQLVNDNMNLIRQVA